MSTGFLWRKDWAADSVRTGIQWIMDSGWAGEQGYQGANSVETEASTEGAVKMKAPAGGAHIQFI